MSNEIGPTLRETILKSELPTLVGDIGESGIDSLLNDGVAKEIPVIGSILAVGKIYGNFRDYYLAKKLISFLQELSSLDSSQRIQLIEKLESDEPYSNKVGEKIIDLLSRLDDQQKPFLVAKAFKLYLAGYLSYVQLQRINNSIERILICDLGQLSEFCNADGKSNTTGDNPILLNYINSGLAYTGSGWGSGGVHPTETAKLLLKVMQS